MSHSLLVCVCDSIVTVDIMCVVDFSAHAGYLFIHYNHLSKELTEPSFE